MTFQPGDLVLCDYRAPSALQPWLHEFHVGIVAEPTDEPALWNGHNSERHYCELTGCVVVEYRFGRMHERPDALRRITTEEAELDHADKVRRFLGEVAYERLVGSYALSMTARR